MRNIEQTSSIKETDIIIRTKSLSELISDVYENFNQNTASANRYINFFIEPNPKALLEAIKLINSKKTKNNTKGVDNLISSLTEIRNRYFGDNTNKTFIEDIISGKKLNNTKQEESHAERVAAENRSEESGYSRSRSSSYSNSESLSRSQSYSRSNSGLSNSSPT